MESCAVKMAENSRFYLKNRGVQELISHAILEFSESHKMSQLAHLPKSLISNIILIKKTGKCATKAPE